MLGRCTRPLARMHSDDHLRTRDRARLRAAHWLRRGHISHDHRAARAVLHALIELLNDKDAGAGCWPGLDALAGATGYSRAWVAECLAWLTGAGLIRRRRGGGRARSTTYRVHPALWDSAAWPLGEFKAIAAAGELPAWPDSTPPSEPRKPTEPRGKKSSRDNELRNKKGPLDQSINCQVAGPYQIDTGGAHADGGTPPSDRHDRPEAGGARAAGDSPWAPLCHTPQGATPPARPSPFAALVHPRPTSKNGSAAREKASAGPRRGGAPGGGGGGSGEGPEGPGLPEQLAAADQAAILAARWASAWGLPAIEVLAGRRGEAADPTGRRRLEGLAPRGWPAAAPAAAMPWRRVFRWVAAGARCEFFVRPVADSAHRAVFVDDLTADDLAKLPRSWARLILETSPGNFQAIFRSPAPLDAPARKAAMRALISHLGAGDLNSAKGDQIHRWPGSMNYKRDEPFATRLVEFVVEGEDLPADIMSGGQEASSPIAEQARAEKTENGTRIHIVRRMPVLQRGAPTKTGGDSSGSGLEFSWALSRLGRGIPPQQVIAELAEKALARGKRKNRIDAEQYASLTVRNAESVIRGE